MVSSKHVFELFKRHVYPGISLGELALVLDNPSWLNRENLRVITSGGGKLPFSWSPKDTIIVIQPGFSAGDRSAIYLKLGGEGIQEEIVFNVLKGYDKDTDHLAIIILDIGYSEMTEEQ